MTQCPEHSYKENVSILEEKYFITFFGTQFLLYQILLFLINNYLLKILVTVIYLKKDVINFLIIIIICFISFIT
jgi:hypothetical protein